jgi:hypothetical protein
VPFVKELNKISNLFLIFFIASVIRIQRPQHLVEEIRRNVCLQERYAAQVLDSLNPPFLYGLIK